MTDFNIHKLLDLLKAWKRINELIEEVESTNRLLRDTLAACGTDVCGEHLSVDLEPVLETREQIAQSMLRVYHDEEKSGRGI